MKSFNINHFTNVTMKSNFIMVICLAAIFGSLSGQPYSKENFSEFQLEVITTFCQEQTNVPVKVDSLIYDDHHLLLRSTFFEYEKENRQVVYRYNQSGKLSAKEFYETDTSQLPDRVRIFRYNWRGKLIYEGYDDDRGNSDERNYSYDDHGLLVKSTIDCNGNHEEYSYEYDEKNRLTGIIENGEPEIYYWYFDNRLDREMHYSRSGDTEIIYSYDKSGLLVSKTVNGKIAEKNTYNNGRLSEKLTYGIGIDPCYDPCCGNYQIKYEYY